METYSIQYVFITCVEVAVVGVVGIVGVAMAALTTKTTTRLARRKDSLPPVNLFLHPFISYICW
jgi:hypothetical protein